jgi:hypothetical protein
VPVKPPPAHSNTVLARTGASYCFAAHELGRWLTVPGRAKMPAPDSWRDLPTETKPKETKI